MTEPKFKVGDVVYEEMNHDYVYSIEQSKLYEDGWRYSCNLLNDDGSKSPVICQFWEYELAIVEGEFPREIEANDVINPNHYMKNGVECIDMIKAIVSDMKGNTAYCVGNVIKYLWRFQNKNGLTDLYKAKKYIEMLIEELEKNDENKI